MNPPRQQPFTIVLEDGSPFIEGRGATKIPGAVAYDSDHIAGLAMKDKKRADLRVEPIADLKAWLEVLIAAGIELVDEFRFIEPISRNPKKWLEELRGGPPEHKNLRPGF